MISVKKSIYCFAALAALTIVLLITAVPAHAEDQVSNNWKYSASEVDGAMSAVIKGYTGSDWDLKIPSQIGGYTVRKIGDYAFSENYSVKSVVIPDTVTEIGDAAFRSCKYATAITIGKNVKKIGMYAFAGTGISSIVIPDSVTSVGESTVSGCTSLRKITISKNLTSIPVYFCSNTAVTELRIPEGVTRIGGAAFMTCRQLEKVQLPKTLEKIGTNVFEEDTNLKMVNMPEGLDEIGQSAFKNCTKLETITIPSTVRYIVTDAFHNCTSLKNVIAKCAGTSAFVYGYSIGYNSGSVINENVTIYCIPGSSVHDYAVSNGLKTANLSSAPVDPAQSLSLDPVSSGTGGAEKTTQTVTKPTSTDQAKKYTPAKVKIAKVKKGKKKATVYWKRIAKNVKGYQIELKKGKTVKKATVKQGKKKTLSKVVKKLKKGKWTVRVRAYNKVSGKTYYGAWSAAKKVTVK